MVLQIFIQMLAWVAHGALHGVSRRQSLSSTPMAPLEAAPSSFLPRRPSGAPEAWKEGLSEQGPASHGRWR